MLNNTLKRTAATLGVLAGLLAAAAPASAQLPPTTTGVTASGGWPDGTAQNSAFHELILDGIDVGYTPPVGPNKGSFTASGGWEPIHALDSQGIALHAVATAIVGGLVPGGAIVSA